MTVAGIEYSLAEKLISSHSFFACQGEKRLKNITVKSTIISIFKKFFINFKFYLLRSLNSCKKISNLKYFFYQV
jgi:hypothetical protein